MRYHLPASENIGFGQIEALNGMEQIIESARKSGARCHHRKFAGRLSDHARALVSWRPELSLGQWQKIALARAFMRDAEILVLDEPTASLDAETEYEIFRHFQELTEGKMAILISHRFSTVRMADRIVVIQEGRIAEIGSHHDLLNQGGIYGQLFSLQAEGYR